VKEEKGGGDHFIGRLDDGNRKVKKEGKLRKEGKEGGGVKEEKEKKDHFIGRLNDGNRKEEKEGQLKKEGSKGRRK
jgi:hypothetical protein